jgi:hypothetical protein
MKTHHSDSLILVWRVAEYEARQMKDSSIDPVHLLLGICKMVDLDLPALVSKELPNWDEVLEELLREVRRLRKVFLAVELNAKTFRRRLRNISAVKGHFQGDSKRVRRSKAARQVFADAENFAAIGGCAVFPMNLLCAILFAEDVKRDDLLKDLGVNKRRFQEITKREALFLPRGFSLTGRDEMRLRN